LNWFYALLYRAAFFITGGLQRLAVFIYQEDAGSRQLHARLQGACAKKGAPRLLNYSTKIIILKGRYFLQQESTGCPTNPKEKVFFTARRYPVSDEIRKLVRPEK
jgi:hypothetical protein